MAGGPGDVDNDVPRQGCLGASLQDCWWTRRHEQGEAAMPPELEPCVRLTCQVC